MLRVSVLGKLSLEVDGAAVPAPAARRARALLGWLALHPGTHARAELAARFWPDVLDSSARMSLRTALLGVRRALGPAGEAALVASREAVGLVPGQELWTDVAEFDRLVASDRLEEALTLCRGDLLTGLTDDWILVARDEHRDRVAAVLARLAEQAEEHGDLTAAIRWTRSEIAAAPLSEEAHRRLIARLAASGDRAAALRAYDGLCGRLRDELGVAASAETRALAERVRGGEVAPAVRRRTEERAPLPPVLAAREAVGFVGRRAELAVLEAAWERAREGERRAVLIAGEAGIGKTRLVAELCRRVHADEAIVLYGRCDEQTPAAYRPVIEALRWRVASADPSALRHEVGAGAGELTRLLPDLGHVTPCAAPPATGDPEGERYRLFEAVVAWVGAIAVERPVVLAVDDLHWADTSSLLLLAHVVRSLPAAPLLLVATYRPVETAAHVPLAAALADLHREPSVEWIALDGLAEEDVAALVQTFPGGDPVAARVRTLREETAGNPFFLQELLRRPPGGAGVPQSVKDVIGQRLVRLGRECNAVLSTASVIGTSFSAALLAALGSWSEDELLDALDEATRAHVVAEEPGTVGRYVFAHALVRETLYGELSATRRARVHLRVAEALERLTADEPEPPLADLARHWCAAAAVGDVAKAVDYARRAGDRAMGQVAFEQAAEHYGAALAVLEASPDGTAERCDLLLARATAEASAGDVGAARDTFEAAGALARKLGSAERLAQAALGCAGPVVEAGASDARRIGLLEEALGALAGGDAALRGAVMARLAMELTYTDSFERRDALSREAVELVRGTGDRRALSGAMHSRQYAIQGPDTHDERMCLADEMVEIGRELGAPEVEGQGLVWRIRAQLELGARAEVDADIARHAALAAARPTPLDCWLATFFAAMRALLDGRLAEAERLALEAATTGAPLLDRPMPGDEELLQVTMVTRTRFGDVLGAVRVQLSEIWVEQGRGEELVAALRASAEDLPLVPAWRCGLAMLQARLGNGAEARAEIGRLVDGDRVALPRDGLWMAGAAMLGEACALVRDERAAATVYDALLPYRDWNVVVGAAVSCQGSVERTLALLAAARGRLDDAARHFEAALAFNVRIGARVWTARTQHDYAAMLLERDDPGDRERAEALLAQAAATANELRLVDIAERVRALGGAPIGA